ncbi:MAG: ATP-binding protein [Elusimicrobiota bacterium]
MKHRQVLFWKLLVLTIIPLILVDGIVITVFSNFFYRRFEAEINARLIDKGNSVVVQVLPLLKKINSASNNAGSVKEREILVDILTQLAPPDTVCELKVFDINNRLVADKINHQQHAAREFSFTFPVNDSGTVVGNVLMRLKLEKFYHDLFVIQMQLMLFLSAIALIILAVIMFIVLKFSISDTVIQAAEDIDAYLKGDGQRRIKKYSGDEIGYLMQNVNGILDYSTETRNTIETLMRGMRVLTSKLDIEEIFSRMVELICQRYDNVSCAVFTASVDGRVRVRKSVNLSPDFVDNYKVGVDEGRIGAALDKMAVEKVDNVAEDKNEVLYDVLIKEGIGSYVYLPIIVMGQSFGLVAIYSRKKEGFTKEMVNEMTVLVEYLNEALRSAKLYEQAQEANNKLQTEVSVTTKELSQTNYRLVQRVRQLHTLYDLAINTSAILDLPTMMDTIVKKIKELLNVETVGILLLDQEKEKLELQKSGFNLTDDQVSRVMVNLKTQASTVSSAIFSSGQSFMSNDPVKDNIQFSEYENIIKIESVILSALSVNNQPLGLLVVANKLMDKFNQEDMRLLSILISWMAEMIQNVRLYAELQQRLHDLNVMHELSASIESDPVLSETLGKILGIISRSFEGDNCAILLLNNKTGELELQGSGANIKEGTDARSFSAEVFRTGKAVVENNAQVSSKSHGYQLNENVNALMIFPLAVEAHNIGVLQITSGKTGRFGRDMVKLGKHLADQAAVIIENARLYGRLQDMNKDLERLNKVKNEFISIVSHELRTPLTALKGFVGVLLEEEAGEINDQQRKFLMIVENSIERLSLLINDLLDISRIETGQLKMVLSSIDLYEVVDSAVENFSTQVKDKELVLKSEVMKGIFVFGDRLRLGQVVDNLINNAIKFTPRGGLITVKTEPRGSYVCVIIKDTGIGIPVEEKDKVFDKFYQVDSSYSRQIGGTGLGLAIAKSIVELHGGKIWVESEPEHGAEFKFMLKLSESKSPASKKEGRTVEKVV